MTKKVKKKKKKTPSTNDLNKFYNESVSVDKRVFAEQRSNVLLYAGEHYAKTDARIWGPIRESSRFDNSTKIRITKNHIQRICKRKVNGIVTYAPGVTIMPRNESELQDQKAAELHQSVWQYLKDKLKLDEDIVNYAQDLVIHGEIFVKVAWDPNKGRHVAFHQATDDAGNPLWDEEPDEMMGVEGTPTPGDAIFSGDLIHTRMFSFNMLRDSRARSIKDSSFLCYQQLMPVEEALLFADGDPEKEEFIKGSDVDSADYVAFDVADKTYVDTKDQVLIREWFFRPCVQYPKGLYILDTPKGKVIEMELPNGIFPIIYAGYDEMSNTARHYSIIRVLRPGQAEVNRCGSKIVEHQVTLGDDKIVSQMGGRMSQGSTLPGIRHVQVAGQTHTVIPGRAGDQYLGWLQASISEMYDLAEEPEEEQEKGTTMDAYQLLNASMKQRKRYTVLAGKFERFLKDLCEVSLEYYRYFVPDDELISVIGRSEEVNIEEFKNSKPLGYQIKVQEQTDDSESKLGKMLQNNTVLQYVGTKLEREDIGRIIRNGPYANKEGLFEDLTVEYDNSVNDILALDRGKYPQARKYDKHEYQVKRLETRMSKPDYVNLHPFIQSLYDKKVFEHNQIISQNVKELQLAESGFIPADGPLIPVDFYVQDPTSPKKTQRARFPLGAIMWLEQKLGQQGVQQDALISISQGGQVQLARQTQTAQPQGGQMPPQAQGGQSQDPMNNLTQPYLSRGGAGTPQ